VTFSRVCAAAHEAGHIVAAKREGAELKAPLFIPAGLGIIGTFGAITQVRSMLRNRQQLLLIAAAGPAAGTAASLAAVTVGVLLTLTQSGPLAQERSALPIAMPAVTPVSACRLPVSVPQKQERLR
jgi:Zn-dependent protease